MPMPMPRHLTPLLIILTSSLSSAQIGTVPEPPGNPITLDKANLGKVLFWDEQLSSTRTVACGTCHLPRAGGADPRSLDLGVDSTHPGFDGLLGSADDISGSPGVIRNLANGHLEKDAIFGLGLQVTGRNTPSMINAAFAPELFWDGRASDTFRDPVTGAVVLARGAALESQAAGPPVSDVEMGHVGRDWTEIEAQLGALEPLALAEDIPLALKAWMGGQSHGELFELAFGSPEISAARVAMALATYERTLISDQAPFDAFLAGNTGALTRQERQGRAVFNGPGRCNLCHGGPLLTDQRFHNIGLRPPVEDPGRAEVTGALRDRGRFKTPSLRNVALRAPYFHNGSATTLEEVVSFYNRGGDFGVNQDLRIVPLGLGRGQQDALVAFLGALTDPRVAGRAAPFDRPTLFSESSRASSLIGVSSPSTGGALPRIIANQPAQAGNPSLTIAVDGALDTGIGFLLFDTVSDPLGSALRGAQVFLGFSPGLQVLERIPLSGTGVGKGWASYTTPIPRDVSLVGRSVFVQWLIFEPGLGALASTPAAEMHVF
jgi:cytochrome c peroxidase